MPKRLDRVRVSVERPRFTVWAPHGKGAARVPGCDLTHSNQGPWVETKTLVRAPWRCGAVALWRCGAVARRKGLVLRSRGITVSKWSEETNMVGASYFLLSSARAPDDPRTRSQPSFKRV